MRGRYVGETVHVGHRVGTIRQIDGRSIDVRMNDDPDADACWYRAQDVRPWPPRPKKPPRPYSPAEAVAALEQVAKRWPPHLELFSWSGSLVVIDQRKNEGTFGAVRESAIVGYIAGIPNDGGDPNHLIDE